METRAAEVVGIALSSEPMNGLETQQWNALRLHGLLKP